MSFYSVYPPPGGSTLAPGSATAANQTTQIGIETTTRDNVAALNAKGMAALFTLRYDELDITYVGASTDISTVTSKLAGVTQQTLTLGYDGSDRLISAVVS